MRLHTLAEPELEFAAGGRHIDPRFGISSYGPADRTSATAPKEIRLGIVGIRHDTEGLRHWLERCQKPIDAPSGKAARMGNYFPPFPGFISGDAFDSELRFDDRAIRDIRVRDIEQLQALPPAAAARAAVKLYVEQIEELAEENWCSVILCCHPDLPEPADTGQSRRMGEENFHDLRPRTSAPAMSELASTKTRSKERCRPAWPRSSTSAVTVSSFAAASRRRTRTTSSLTCQALMR